MANDTLKAKMEQMMPDTLARLQAHLASCGIDHIQDTTLEALRSFPWDLPANDDANLRALFVEMGRQELVDHTRLVSANKYFRNKQLRTALGKVDAFQPHLLALRKIKVRLAAELWERGKTPEGRAALAEASGLSEETVLQLVRACDLCRMTGMGGKTLARCLAMGYETLVDFRAATPEGIQDDLDAYLALHSERTSRMISYPDFIWFAQRLEDSVVA